MSQIAPETMLSAMQGASVTQGWDVVCAMSLDPINALLLAQYLEGSGTPTTPINTLSITARVLEDLFVALDVTVGPPLITFLSSGEQCELSMWLTGGTLSVETIEAGVTTVAQILTVPPNVCQISGTVDLVKVAGQVSDEHDVRVDLGGGAYTVNLPGLGIVGNNAVGTAIEAYFQETPVQYPLGTVSYGQTTTYPWLTPTSFDFATQVDGDGNQCLLLLVTTKGSAGTPGPMTFLNGPVPIPQGYSASLFVSSQALFEGVLAVGYQTLFDAHDVGSTMRAIEPQDPTQAWSVVAQGGSFKIAGVSGTYATKAMIKAEPWWTGDASGSASDPAGVQIPADGLTVSPSGNTLSVSWSGSWSQEFGYEYWADMGGMNPSQLDPTSAAMTIDVSLSEGGFTLSVSEPAETVTIAGSPLPVITFDPNNTVRDYVFADPAATKAALGEEMPGALGPILTAVFAIDLSAISLFAVSNLLFPAAHIMTLQEVNAPGDLVIFGAVETLISVTPSLQTLGQGESQQFTATVPGAGGAVGWSIQPSTSGSITRDGGLYTAPSSVASNQAVLVTATSGTQYGSALVLLEAPITVSPSAAQLIAGQEVQFSAIANGAPAAVNWLPLPASAGTIDDDGNYSAPSTLAVTTTVTVTATSQTDGSVSASAVVTLAPSLPSASVA